MPANSTGRLTPQGPSQPTVGATRGILASGVVTRVFRVSGERSDVGGMGTYQSVAVVLLHGMCNPADDAA